MKKVSDVTKARPFELGLVSLGSEMQLARLTDRLNRLQKIFHYEPFSPGIDLPRKYDLKHIYSDKVYYSAIEKALYRTDYNYCIGITNERLQESSFNRHDHNRGTGVITIADAEGFTPWDKTINQYLAYLILCESYCLVGKKHYEHSPRRFCLFDECHDLKDLVKCLQRPHICNKCKKRLMQRFEQSDIEGAQPVLDYVGKPSILRILSRSFGNPLWGFFLGGFLTQFLYERVASLPTPWPDMVGVVLIVGLIVTPLISYRRASPGHNPKSGGTLWDKVLLPFGRGDLVRVSQID